MKPCKTDVERARAVIRWIGENVQYDGNFLKTGKITGDQSAEAVILTGRAVCEGYSNAFKFLGKYDCFTFLFISF